MTTKSFKEFITEESHKKEVSVWIGRGSPPHIGHFRMIEMMKYSPVILIVKGKTTSEDTLKNPFPVEKQIEWFRMGFPNAEIRKVNNANLSPILFHLSKEFDVKEIMAGEDRIESYKKTIQKTGQSGRILITQTPRVTSATKVREAIRNHDITTFKQLMPKQLHNQWQEMLKFITS